MRKITSLISVAAISYGALAFAQTQQIDPNQAEQAPFASENAIIDTSIPFAIGAREAQQSLRGSFGWPTFQEGLVNGVYFRFDPDGYARFAPTPRLDSDVFEVICRPRTYSCMGRKGSFSILLNSRGQLQLKIDDVLSGDRFFVSEGVSEIEIPERILQPLDTQLELLLSSGGDLIVRRSDTEKDRISLTGFMAVSAYLRWVAARQDYTILPRGWPIPNANGSEAGVTQAASWQSPMPQPQNFQAARNGTTQAQLQPATQTLQVQTQPNAAANAQTEVDEVRSELKVLRELLMERTVQAQSLEAEQAQPANPSLNGSIAQLMPQTTTQPSALNDQIAALQQASAQIQADLQRLTQTRPAATGGLSNVSLTPVVQPANTMVETSVIQAAPLADDPTIETAKRLQYLISEIGLDAKTALMLIQMGDKQSTEPSAAMQTAKAAQNAQPADQEPAFQDNVVAQILQELEDDLLDRQQPSTAPKATPKTKIPETEFLLLSQYFKSVVMDQ